MRSRKVEIITNLAIAIIGIVGLVEICRLRDELDSLKSHVCLDQEVVYVKEECPWHKVK